MTLFENFEGFSQILKEQSGEKSYLDVFVNTPDSNNLNIWKFPYLKKKLGVHVVFDFADTRFLNFAIEYLWENEKFPETDFACSYGA